MGSSDPETHEPRADAGAPQQNEPRENELRADAGVTQEPDLRSAECYDARPEAAEGPQAADGSATQEAGASAALSEELAAVRSERDSYLDDLQRVTAEFANYRRQTARRNADTVARAVARLAESLLPVLDAFDNAVGQGVEGIGAVQSQMLGALREHGLVAVGAAGEPFDPNRHEAVTYEEAAAADEDAGPVIAEVLMTGYEWNSRVLRPAMVRVRG